MKEQYFLPYVAQRGLVRAPAEGRQKLGREAASRYKRIRSLCAEDIGALEARLTERLR